MCLRSSSFSVVLSLAPEKRANDDTVVGISSPLLTGTVIIFCIFYTRVQHLSSRTKRHAKSDYCRRSKILGNTTFARTVAVYTMVHTVSSSYGAVEDHRVGRFYGKHTSNTRSSRTSTRNNSTRTCTSNNSINTTSTGKSDDLRQRDDDGESRSASKKRRPTFGEGVVIVLASMIAGYVLGSAVASSRENRDDVLLGRLDRARANNADESLLAGREVATEEEVRTILFG